jgi:hypothetical protein
MMELLKRHLFLISLVAGTVVVSAAVIVLVLVFETWPAQTTQKAWEGVKGQVRTLDVARMVLPENVTQLAAQEGVEAKQYKGDLDWIKAQGKARTVVVEDLFPASTDIGLRHRFKNVYLGKLADLAKGLDAVPPPSYLEKTAEPDAATHAEAAAKGLMYYHPDQTFVRPAWTSPAHTQAPSMEECRTGQEDLWLLEDLVAVLKKMNDDILASREDPKARERTIKNSPIKELVTVRIGGQNAAMPGTPMTPFNERYVPVADPKAGGRAPTLTGRWSLPDEKEKGEVVKRGMYKVLPWRMVVVVESRYSGELTRRLKGRESFLTVAAAQERPIVEAMFEGGSRDWLAKDRQAYGPEGVVRLEIVGESLVFQLEGGRVTTPPLKETKAAPAPEAAAPK